MTGVKILHTGDLHIGSSRTGVKNGRVEIMNTFFRIIELCKTENVEFLLIAGDLFDTPFPDNDIVGEIIHAMKQIPETIIAISPGNHDCACPGSVWLKYNFPENVFIFTNSVKSYEFPDKNVCLYGAAFTDKYEPQPLPFSPEVLDDNTINLCVLHGDVVSALSDSDYNPITSDVIQNSGFDYLALGHIHKRSEIALLGNTHFSYCGCPDGRGFDEDGSHGIYIGTISRGRCSLEYSELSSRQYIINTLDITGCVTSSEIADKILGYIRNTYTDYARNLYRITLTGTVSSGFVPNSVQIEAVLSEHLTHIRITDKTDPDFSEIERIANENSLRGIFVKKMLELSESADSKDTERYHQALKLGLKAFEKEVTLDGN